MNHLSTATIVPFFRFIVAVQLTGSMASAGMPTITLTDVARVRFSTLSFFLMVCLLSAWGVKALWNFLRTDFTKLPPLSWRGSLAGVILWGLTCVIVLTMISGTRELMTPGAWEKNGLTYRLTTPPSAASAEMIATEVARQLDEQTRRREHLQQLGLAIQKLTVELGRHPDSQEFKSLPADLRRLTGPVNAEYIYVNPGADTAGGVDPVVAFEPSVFADGTQLAYYRSGQIAPFSEEALANSGPHAEHR